MKKLAVFVVVVFAMSAYALADSTLYTQTFDESGNLYSSQNDPATFGVFAQMYDNFAYTTAAGTYTVTNVQFTGGYFNPPNQGPIVAWNINIYDDNGGQPGSLIYGAYVNGSGNETFLGTYGGFPVYTYSIATDFQTAVSGTQYWLSVYPDLDFPPQWGWASANGGDGVSWQDFQGARSMLGVDAVFTVVGHDNQSVVPEPGTLLMLGTGALGLAGVIRRKLF